MNYDEAKKKQIEEFKKGRYFVLSEDFVYPGFFELIPTYSKSIAQESIVNDVIAVVKRMPPRLRPLPGGKK